MNLSAEEYRNSLPQLGKPNKYKAIKTELDGILFHSKKEAKRYAQLKQMELTGIISRFELQPKLPIYINDQLVCNVILDFKYWKNGWVFEDVKGRDNAMSRLKRKLVQATYNLQVVLV